MKHFRLATKLFGAALLAARVALGDPETHISTSDGSTMLLVPAGDFVMGSSDGAPDEYPPHVVRLKAFYMDKFEVTREQYARFILATGHKAPTDWPDGKLSPQLAKYPVVNVTFADAAAYAKWAGKRLPTEAEWEKAARGKNGWSYPWGNSVLNKKSAVGEAAKGHTHPVGSFPDDTTPFGIMDMAGNVWEWTSDWYDAYDGNDNLEIEFGEKYKVVRGGGAVEQRQGAPTRRGSQRMRSAPYGSNEGLGFRCVKEAE